MLPRVIFGLGTGRCGTVSLSSLLARQPGVVFSEHEGMFVPFDATPEWRSFAKEYWFGEGCRAHTAFWYIHYALPLAADSSVRIIVLQRDEAEVVRSFMQKTADGRNHWQPHNGPYCRFDRCFPQFSHSLTKEEAIVRYVRYYQNAVEKIRGRAFFLRTDDLNPGKVREMLRWCGVDEPDTSVLPWENRTLTPESSHDTDGLDALSDPDPVMFGHNGVPADPVSVQGCPPASGDSVCQQTGYTADYTAG